MQQFMLQNIFNWCTTRSRTYQTTSNTTKFKQISIEIPIRYIWKRNLPSSTSEGASLWGIPRETPTGEPRRKINLKFIPIKATIHWFRTSESAYSWYIPRVTSKVEPGKNPIKILSSKHSAVIPRKTKISKNKNWHNQSGYTEITAPWYPRSWKNNKKCHQSGNNQYIQI